MRLSNNWLTQKLSYVYIEYMRNVPVLLHILLIYGIIVHSMPKTKQALNFNDTFFLSNRGLMSPSGNFETGMWIVLAVLLLGALFTLWFRSYARRIQDTTGRTYPVGSISLIAVLIVPVAVYFIVGSPITWEYPVLKGFNFKGGMVIRPEFIAMFLALTIYTAAFISETVRSGILSVTKGQKEASSSLGLKKSWIMRLIIIPQALRVIVPPLTSQYLNLTKNSSLGIAVGYADLVHGFGGISLNQTGQAIECMVIVMATYLTISLTISVFMNIYNRSIQFKEK